MKKISSQVAPRLNYFGRIKIAEAIVAIRVHIGLRRSAKHKQEKR